MKRKVNRVGQNTLTVSLPSKWARKYNIKAGDEIVVPRKTEHRLSSTGKIGRILEVSFGHFDEKDIERLDDVYGRK